ncbi:MAG: VCBS repeat-containing protein, partial [Candidatus Cloacimonadaceae bacterium]|nr:VCBS repeat-containing protein [Candidatus Cloacimonadaceae bacterium]
HQPITVTVDNLTGYSTAPFIVTFGSTRISPSAFAAKVDFTTGSSPQGIAIGDVDGDGKADLVVSNYLSSTVSVFRNTSTTGSITSGSFAAKVDFTTGSYPWGVALGDVDGDGKLDIAVSNYGSNTVSVLRNTSSSGSISFAARVDFVTGAYPYAVAIHDLDGDGKPDLALANYTSSTVSVLRNTSFGGSISFAGKVDFGTGSGPKSIAVSDLDGDGKPDLVVGNSGASNVSVLRNTSSSGTIGFAAKVDFTTGSNAYGVAIGDLDGDSKREIAVSNYGSGTISVLRNTSTSGSITSGSFATKVDFTTGSGPFGIAIAPLDGDSKPDIVVTNSLSNSISVLWNSSTSGNISFVAKVDFPTASSPQAIAIGDIDGDGKLELAGTNTGSNSVSVLRNTIPSSSPTVTTNAATNITTTTATLNGTVNANGLTTTVRFIYGTTSGVYTDSLAATPGTVTGTNATPVLANISG